MHWRTRSGRPGAPNSAVLGCPGGSERGCTEMHWRTRSGRPGAPNSAALGNGTPWRTWSGRLGSPGGGALAACQWRGISARFGSFRIFGIFWIFLLLSAFESTGRKLIVEIYSFQLLRPYQPASSHNEHRSHFGSRYQLVACYAQPFFILSFRFLSSASRSLFVVLL